MSTAVGQLSLSCPTGMAHLPGREVVHRMICRRLADEKGFMHLGGKRVAWAMEAMVELTYSEALPSATALRSYCPKVAHCLYPREDCIIHILTQREKKRSRKNC